MVDIIPLCTKAHQPGLTPLILCMAVLRKHPLRVVSAVAPAFDLNVFLPQWLVTVDACEAIWMEAVFIWGAHGTPLNPVPAPLTQGSILLMIMTSTKRPIVEHVKGFLGRKDLGAAVAAKTLSMPTTTQGPVARSQCLAVNIPPACSARSRLA